MTTLDHDLPCREIISHFCYFLLAVSFHRTSIKEGLETVAAEFEEGPISQVDGD